MGSISKLVCAVLLCALPIIAAEELRVAVNEVAALQDDEYICQTHDVKDDSIYVTNYKPDLNRTLVHHILIYGCKAAQPGTRRNCFVPCDWSPSGGGSRIIYAWANEAPELNLPQDVSFQLGQASGWKHIVIQVHYKDKFKDPKSLDSSGIVLSYQKEKTKYTAGIYLFASALFRIQPHDNNARALLKCTMELEQPIYVFAVRVHAHSLRKAIGVYTYNNSQWERIVERSPQRAQAFYPLPTPVRFDNGLDVAARCIFDASETDHAIGMGSTRTDEMCNAYLMFYTENTEYTYNTCDDPSPELPLPEPDKTEMAFKGDGHVHAHGGPSDHAAMGHGDNKQSEGHQHMDHMHAEEKHVHEEPKWKFEVNRDTAWSTAMRSDQFPIIGQVGGVSKDDSGNLFVFHRGPRTWNSFSFDGSNRFAHKVDGPIQENAILVVSPNGTVIDAFGSNTFYMPHGITVCQKSNAIWLTDVALHQIFRYDYKEVMNRSDKSKFDIKPTLVLGEAFEPGKDEGHFCQPAGVATLPDGTAVIADGYCNTRLLTVSPSGKIARSVPLTDNGKTVYVVHDVVYDRVSKMMFAADRENGRVFAVDQDSLAVSFVVTPNLEGTRIFALGVFQPLACQQTVIVALNQSDTANGKPGAVFFISPTEKKVVDIVPLPSSSDKAHTMIIDSINGWITVGQIFEKWQPDQLLRFQVSLLGSCGLAATMEFNDGLIDKIYEKNKELMGWITASIQSPSSFIGLLVFILSSCVVIVISVLVCRVCRRRSSATNTRRPPRGSNRDYAAQYSLLVGDAAVKRNGGGKKNNSGFEDLTDEDDEDDIIDRRLVTRPPGGGAKSRFVGFPPEGGSPSRKNGDGDKIV